MLFVMAHIRIQNSFFIQDIWSTPGTPVFYQ